MEPPLSDIQTRAVLALIRNSWEMIGWLSAGDRRDRAEAEKFKAETQRVEIVLNLRDGSTTVEEEVLG